jgi:hypothetical protein
MICQFAVQLLHAQWHLLHVSVRPACVEPGRLTGSWGVASKTEVAVRVISNGALELSALLQ